MVGFCKHTSKILSSIEVGNLLSCQWFSPLWNCTPNGSIIPATNTRRMLSSSRGTVIFRGEPQCLEKILLQCQFFQSKFHMDCTQNNLGVCCEKPVTLPELLIANQSTNYKVLCSLLVCWASRTTKHVLTGCICECSTLPLHLKVSTKDPGLLRLSRTRNTLENRKWYQNVSNVNIHITQNKTVN